MGHTAAKMGPNTSGARRWDPDHREGLKLYSAAVRRAAAGKGLVRFQIASEIDRGGRQSPNGARCKFRPSIQGSVTDTESSRARQWLTPVVGASLVEIASEIKVRHEAISRLHEPPAGGVAAVLSSQLVSSCYYAPALPNRSAVLVHRRARRTTAHSHPGG